MFRSRFRRCFRRPLRFETVEPRVLLAADWAGLDQVRAEYGLTGHGQTVAVIDTGVAYRHAALGGGFGGGFRVVGGYDFTEEDANPYDDGPSGGHGTHVAGIVAGANANQPGVAPGADLIALRVFDDNGQGSLGRVEEALDWVLANRNAFRWPITTVNISLGVRSNSDIPPGWESLEDKLAQLDAQGIFVSVAAGNGYATYKQGVNYPASSPYVVPVASADDSGSLSATSQRDARVLVAPGRNVLSSLPDYAGNHNGVDDDFGRYSGTSMAAAFVSGASMLVREACQTAGIENVTRQSLYDILVNTADTLRDPATGRVYHRINLKRAIDSVLPGDDFGSSEASASDVGSLSDSRVLSGALERRGDSDWFRFTAAQTGKVTLKAENVNDLAAQWLLSAAPPQAERLTDGGLRFDVVTGQVYRFGLTSSGAGRYMIKADFLAAIPSTPDPVLSTPDPVLSTPDPVLSTPDPILSTPDPVLSTPDPVLSTPDPVPSTPDPVPSTPDPVLGTPDPVVEGPPPLYSYRIDTAGQWFTLTVPDDGILAVEAAFSSLQGDVDLQLFDAAGRLVGSSETTADCERIEVRAAAGAQYRLRAFTYPGSGVNEQVALLATHLAANNRLATKPLLPAAVDLLLADRARLV